MDTISWRIWLEKWDMASLHIAERFLEMDWQPQEADRSAAGEFYIELLTRMALPVAAGAQGDEKANLESVSSLLDAARQILRTHSRTAMEFAKLAVAVANQLPRPFVARWRSRNLDMVFAGSEGRKAFGMEWIALMATLTTLARMLADMADVEDLTTLETDDGQVTAGWPPTALAAA